MAKPTSREELEAQLSLGVTNQMTVRLSGQDVLGVIHDLDQLPSGEGYYASDFPTLRNLDEALDQLKGPQTQNQVPNISNKPTRPPPSPTDFFISQSTQSPISSESLSPSRESSPSSNFSAQGSSNPIVQGFQNNLAKIQIKPSQPLVLPQTPSQLPKQIVQASSIQRGSSSASLTQNRSQPMVKQTKVLHQPQNQNGNFLPTDKSTSYQRGPDLSASANVQGLLPRTQTPISLSKTDPLTQPSSAPAQMTVPTMYITYDVPSDWELHYTPDGRVFFKDHKERTTHWAPSEGWGVRKTPEGSVYYVHHPTKTTHWKIPPAGWEWRTTSDGTLYYLDHNNKTTHWSLPD